VPAHLTFNGISANQVTSTATVVLALSAFAIAWIEGRRRKRDRSWQEGQGTARREWEQQQAELQRQWQDEQRRSNERFLLGLERLSRKREIELLGWRFRTRRDAEPSQLILTDDSGHPWSFGTVFLAVRRGAEIQDNNSPLAAALQVSAETWKKETGSDLPPDTIGEKEFIDGLREGHPKAIDLSKYGDRIVAGHLLLVDASGMAYRRRLSPEFPMPFNFAELLGRIAETKANAGERTPTDKTDTATP
jgi:hypothetical protein